MYSTSLLFLQPNLVEWYIIIFWSVLSKNCSVVFKVKVIVKVKIFIGSFLYIFCATDLLATKLCVLIFYFWQPNTTKWAHTTVAPWLTASLGIQLDGCGGGSFATQDDKPCFLNLCFYMWAYESRQCLRACKLYIHTYMCGHTYICVHAGMHACVYICIHVCTLCIWGHQWVLFYKGAVALTKRK